MAAPSIFTYLSSCFSVLINVAIFLLVWRPARGGGFRGGEGRICRPAVVRVGPVCCRRGPCHRLPPTAD